MAVADGSEDLPVEAYKVRSVVGNGLGLGQADLFLPQRQSNQLVVTGHFALPTARPGAQPGGFEGGEGFKAVAIGFLQVGEVQEDGGIRFRFVLEEGAGLSISGLEESRMLETGIGEPAIESFGDMKGALGVPALQDPAAIWETMVTLAAITPLTAWAKR